MELRGCIGIILTAACMQAAVAQADLDTLWLCNDSIRDGSAEQLWFRMYLSDTFPDNRGPFEMVDTGDSQDGSKYINFDYQFGNPHPGYAGFKIYWDFGIVKFYTKSHDSMVFWHKGPLAGHKVQMIWAAGDACGTPPVYQYFGEYKSSSVWKRESFPFPQNRGQVSEFPDSPFVRDGLYELRMLIYNDSTITTSPTSEKGCLKLDNMCFIKKSSAANRVSKLVPGASGDATFFVPKVSGRVTLAIFSLQGEQLFKETVNVSAGKKYNVRRFALKNSNLPVSWIHLVQVSGSGVDIAVKVFR